LFFEAAVAAGWLGFFAMPHLAGRWTCYECPWASQCTASSWKKRNSSYESEAGNG
jgi:hypothetical protein